jgi:hypothetical protein
VSDRSTFGTDLSSQIGLGVIFGFAVALGVGAAFEGAYVLGLVCIVIGLGTWLYYASLRVTVSSKSVVVRRYGIVVFSAPRESVRASVGHGGELKTHTALLLEAPGQKRVELLRTLFGRKTLSELAELLEAREKIPGGIF